MKSFEPTPQFLQSLVDSGARESAVLEFKRELLPGTEIAKQLSAFANTEGGTLLLGVDERRDKDGKGTIGAVPGCKFQQGRSAVQQALISATRVHVEPPLTGVKVDFIDGFELGPVVAVRVGRGGARPYAHKDGTLRFYGRTDHGMEPLAMNELRRMFSEGADFAASAEGRRYARTRLLSAERFSAENASRFTTALERMTVVLDEEDQLPTRLQWGDGNTPGVMVHVFSSDLLTGAPLTIENLTPALFTELGFERGRLRYNVDGALLWDAKYGNDEPEFEYHQVFRDGYFEWAVTDIAGSASALRGDRTENYVIGATQRGLRLLDAVGASFPMLATFTIVGLGERSIETAATMDDRLFGRGGSPVERETLRLPKVLFADQDVDVAGELQPAFNAMWQASGRPRRP